MFEIISVFHTKTYTIIRFIFFVSNNFKNPRSIYIYIYIYININVCLIYLSASLRSMYLPRCYIYELLGDGLVSHVRYPSYFTTEHTNILV